jgi:hypothetical protein
LWCRSSRFEITGVRSTGCGAKTCVVHVPHAPIRRTASCICYRGATQLGRRTAGRQAVGGRRGAVRPSASLARATHMASGRVGFRCREPADATETREVITIRPRARVAIWPHNHERSPAEMRDAALPVGCMRLMRLIRRTGSLHLLRNRARQPGSRAARQPGGLAHADWQPCGSGAMKAHRQLQLPDDYSDGRAMSPSDRACKSFNRTA